MRRAWERLLALVPTRRGAVLLFVLALAGYWFDALGWPLAKGRDTWDYLAYYLQLFDGEPPLDMLQVFRTPLTPVVLGVPLDLGGSVALELVLGILYAVSIVAWSATALAFGRLPALLAAALLIVYPPYATLFHQASSDAVFATGLAVWAWWLARTLERPTTRRFVWLGIGIAALVLIRPANQVLVPAVLVPLLVPVAWRQRFRWAAVCLAAALLPLGAWAVHNAVRYDEPRVARGGKAWVPFLRVFLADRTIAPENGEASQRLADLIRREVLAKPPYAALEVPLDAYLANGSNYEVVRLIALSDRVHGRDEHYDVMFESALEAIRENPGTYARGVADTFWEFLRQAPLREDVAPRLQTAPEPPSPTYEAGGLTLPNPQATVLLDGVPYGFVWCASDYIDSCVLADPAAVWPDAERRERYREIVSQVRAWDADLPAREGVDVVTELLNRVTPRYPRPPFWIALGIIGLVLRRPRGARLVLVLWASAFAVLLIHAASQGVAPEFALPLYPLFIVTGLGAIAGDSRPKTQRRGQA